MRKQTTYWLAVAADLGLSQEAAVEIEILLDVMRPEGIDADELAGCIDRFALRKHKSRLTPVDSLPDVPGQRMLWEAQFQRKS